MNYRYLPEPGAVSSAPSCSDGNQSGTSSGTNTVSKSSRRGSKTDSSMKPQSSETLTTSSSPVQVKNTRALSTWLRQAFLASHSQWRERKEAKTTKGTSGRKRSNVFAMFDPDTRSWKTCQVCLILDTSAKSSLRWPKQGSMQDGVCSEQTMWVPRTGVKGSGFWPTPDCQNHRDGSKLRKDNNLAEGGRHGVSLHHAVYYWPTPTVNGNYNRKGLSKTSGDGLATAVQMWPTPRVSDTEGGIVKNVEMKDGTFSRVNKQGVRWGVKLKDAVDHAEKMWPTPRTSDSAGHSNVRVQRIRDGESWHKFQLREAAASTTQANGQLNPMWVEWLMGWPIGWTDLKPLETDKYRQWLQLHGRS